MTQPKSERTEQRRRILRAAAGAPIIFTLPSGAALAATSLTCAQKSQDLAQTAQPAGVAAAPDGWMRFSVQTYSFNGSVSVSSANTFLDASTTKSTSMASNGTSQEALYFTLGNNWYRVLDDGTAAPVTLTANNGKPLGELGTAKGARYVLVDYADYQAGIPQTMYVYPNSSPVINPISGASCWNSLTGATLTSNVIN